MIKFKFFNALTIALILLQAVMPIPALAMANNASQQDYAPGSVVTISGNSSDGFVGDETVDVEVSGPNGIALSCSDTADPDGAWSCDVTVPSDESAAGDYSYTATGDAGASKSGSFTVTAPAPPTPEPTQQPTQEPTQQPTQEPTATQVPTVEPTIEPTTSPTVEATASPTVEPTATESPTVEPSTTATPTEEPRLDPTQLPTPTPTGPVLTPFIQSDKADYAPGQTVTLTSGNWQPGEAVHLIVNDTLGESWRLSDDISADGSGAFTYQFQLPDWFVAEYHVYAYGVISGSATTDFTDANLDTAAITIKQSTCTTNSTAFIYGDTVCASVVVTTSGGGGNPDLVILWVNPGGTTVRTTTKNNVANGSTQTDTFQVKVLGTWTVKACKNTGCSGGNLLDTETFTVTAKALSVSGITANNKTYDGNTTATLNTGSAALVGVVSGDTVTLNTASAAGAFSDKNVGNAKTVAVSGLTIGGASAGNYTLTQPTTTANITAKNLTVSGITANDKTYDGNSTATLNTGSAALLGVVSSDSVTLNTASAAGAFSNKSVGTGKTVAISGLTIGGADAGNYTLTQPTTTANITARPLTVSATGNNKVYDGTTSATVTLSDNRVAGDTLSTSYTSASFADKNVGLGKTINVTGISLSGTDAGNYTFNTSASTTADITARTLTITAAGVSKVYDGTTSATVTLSDNRLVGDAFTDSYTSAAFSDKNVGTSKTVNVSGISISGAEAGNYTFNTTASTTADIMARDLTVTATGVNKVYDGTTTATVNLSDDRISGDVFTGSYTSAAFTNKNIGTGKTINVSGISISGTDAGNYNLLNTTATATANIAALGVTASITANDKTYDGTTAATFSCALDGVVSGEVVNCTGGTASFDDKNVDTGKIVTATGFSLSGADADNYALNNTSATDTADITPLAITGSITAANKIYDGTAAATILTRTLDGAISGDDVSYVGGTATFADKNVGTSKNVTATGLSLAGDDAGNYMVDSTATTTADITARPLTISGTGVNKTYDATTTATVILSDDRVAGDVFTGSYTSASFADKNVGTGKNVSVTGISISGADAGNYTFNTTASATADITPRDLTVTAAADNKVYDATTTAVAHLSDDRISGDVLTVSYTSASFSDKNVGTDKAVSVSGISISGTDAGNYNLLNTTASATADITQRNLTVAATGINKIYDSTTAATVNLSDNKISSDDVTDAYTNAVFTDKNVGTGKTVNVSGISISGDDAGNYNLLNTTATTTANIASLGVTASITANDKTYDGTDMATFSCALTGFISGDSVSCTGGTATFDNKNVATGKTVTASGFSLSGADAGNYAITNATATDTADITALAITGSITAADKVYDGTTAATILTRTLSGEITGDDVSYVGGTATFTDKSVGTDKTVNATGLGLSGIDAGNYMVNDTAATTADITPKTLTASITANNKTYDGNDTVAFACELTGVIELDDVNCTGGVATFDTKNVGTSKTVTAMGLSLDGDDANNYTVNDTATTTADITARTLTITATGINKVYDGSADATVTLSDDRVSGDVFTDSYTSAAFSDKNVGTGKSVSVSGISISGADAGNYTFNMTADTFADITVRTLTITATGLTKIYDGTTNATVVLSDDRVSGDVFTDSYTSASFVDKSVGNDKHVGVSGISISGTDASNYTFNTTASTTADITPRHLTVTAQGINKVYDGTTAATVTLSSNKVSGDDVTASYTSAAFADKNVGTGQTVNVSGISISGADAGNYTFNTSATTTADITPRDLTVSATGTNKTYDGTTAAPVSLSDDKVSGDDVTDAYISASFADKNVGTGKLVSVSGISISGDDAANYNLLNTTANTIADITARILTISATGINKVYDGTTNASATLSDDRVSGDVFTDSYTSAAFSDKNVGTGKTINVSGISISGADAGNYTFNATASTTADISAHALTINAAGINKVYDGATTATVTLSDNRVSGDVFTDSYTSASFADKNVGDGKTVSVSGISISGTDASNYTFNTTASTTADITARDLTVSAAGVNKVYDGSTNATVTLSDDRVSGDAITAAYTSAAFIDKNVGTGKNVNVNGISISGADAGNYNLLNTTASTTADITARTLTINAAGVNKIYDGTTVAAVTLSDNRVSGDVFTDSYTSASFTNKSVGTGKAVNVNGISISGTDAGNYTFNTTATTAADITARDLTVTATVDNKVYDGTTAAVAHLSDNRVAGDAFTDSHTSAAFSDKNVGTGKTVHVGGISISGTDAGNYNLLNTTASATADITARPVTVTANAQTKVYGSSDPALTYQVTSGSVVSGDSFSGALNRATGEDVGSYAINQNTLALSSNYALTYVGANLSITQATLTVTADSKSKYFGAADPAFTFQYSGFVNGDTASVIDTAPTCGVSGAHAAVGSYPITCTGGLDNNYSFNYVNGTFTVSAWTKQGFYSPVDMNGVYNTVKNGSTVPLKFELFAGTTELTDVSAVQPLTAALISCQTGVVEDAIEVTATGNTSLRYDATGGQFIYNWKTPSIANKCYRVTVTAADGVTTLVAYFKTK